MRHHTFGLASIAFVLSSLANNAAATTQRTFVASNGNDANVCSLAQPCRGFARALTQTSPGGEIIVLDSAGYGPVSITQSVSIIAPAGVYAGISVLPAQDGVTIATPGVNVLLRGLLINGQGGHDGVVVNAASVELHVEACTITGLVNDGLNINSAAGTLFIRDSTFRDNRGVGMSMTGVIGTVDRTRVEHNGSDGVGIGQDSWATITDSVSDQELRERDHCLQSEIDWWWNHSADSAEFVRYRQRIQWDRRRGNQWKRSQYRRGERVPFGGFPQSEQWYPDLRPAHPLRLPRRGGKYDRGKFECGHRSDLQLGEHVGHRDKQCRDSQHERTRHRRRLRCALARQ